MECIKSAGLYGMTAYTVEAECDLAPGIPRFDVVGLPDAAVKESRDRVSAAMKNSGYSVPAGRIVVNLAPADLRKAGPLYDLPILLALMTASGQLSAELSHCMFIGELSLDGSLRPVTGVLPMAIHARDAGFRAIFVPKENGAEAAVVSGIDVYAVSHVNELILFLAGAAQLAPVSPAPLHPRDEILPPDFSEVKGQQGARRALEVAAAGGHNALLIGPPGSGKSMLAKRIPSILPDMTFEESIETTKIHSIAGLIDRNAPLVSVRPFRAPHHTISPAGLSGGGSIPHPGEISLAHNGVLFLDELPEFSRDAMEILRQPIEDGQVTISRVSGTLTYPCSMMVIAAMNPCPCGNYPDYRRCSCTEQQIRRYQSKVSGPLLDRIDIRMEVKGVKQEVLFSKQKTESSKTIRARVEQARQMQKERFAGTGLLFNSQLDGKNLEEYITLSEEGKRLVLQLFEEQELSVRGVHRVLKLARTIADLAGSEEIEHAHLQEAAFYRNQDVFAKEVLYGN